MIDYIEVQGISSLMGDRIELSGLTQTFTQTVNEKQLKQKCLIGSLKPNIGHPLAASGMAGLIKILLALKYEQLPPTINIQEINPELKLEKSPFKINTELQSWPKQEGRLRRAAINGFGMNGSNAHLLVEEYKEDRIFESDSTPEEKGVLITLSSKNEERLKEIIEHFCNALKQELSNTRLLDIAYTLQVGREEMEYRLSAFVNSKEDLLELLENYLEGNNTSKEVLTGNVNDSSKDIAWLVDELLEEDILEKLIEKNLSGNLAFYGLRESILIGKNAIRIDACKKYLCPLILLKKSATGFKTKVVKKH